MDTPSEILYPLANASRDNLARVCESLWGWKPCAQWILGKTCYQPYDCPCRHAARLEPFFDFYRDVTAYYIPDLTGDSCPALRSHDDLIDIISLIKKNAERPRSRLTIEYFSQRGVQTPPITDQNRAFSLAARITSMIKCSIENQSDGLLEAGTQPITWHSDKSFTAFVDSAFPKREQPKLNPDDDVASSEKVHLALVTAKRLRKVAHLKAIPTNNLKDHLLLDYKNSTVAIYHYTSVLKEHILACREEAMGQTLGQSTPKSISSNGNIPQQLALETLSTIQNILFPVDPESRSLLRSLVSKEKFDPDILRLEPPSHGSPDEQQIGYEYWGSRLIDLYDELNNPTPRGYVENWLQRKSGSRYMMMATLAGVIIAIFLGILSLAVSIFQAWVGWQQWKHPVAGN
ncbi:uncharacterized protein GGS22DRAFT_166205 [Annulohypoxylon maeteangense]|uniref:uncharacterized protein n=1 Tax=Annulohypoxylon maeteangense TaxID=1927788 RepID=UPI002008E72D|nr:uncharacterized protein GGS22DRAFT_166205 [Annulohypoxylon maeteangense]KAI0883834.1 hypothetical protein GGS22DRAFT_166205 [Annulohypoxylon maeteangense]